MYVLTESCAQLFVSFLVRASFSLHFAVAAGGLGVAENNILAESDVIELIKYKTDGNTAGITRLPQFYRRKSQVPCEHSFKIQIAN